MIVVSTGFASPADGDFSQRVIIYAGDPTTTVRCNLLLEEVDGRLVISIERSVDTDFKIARFNLPPPILLADGTRIVPSLPQEVIDRAQETET